MNKPANGFGLQKESVPMNDPYQTYNQSVLDHDEIWSALTTEAGRQAIGAQIVQAVW